MSFFNTKYLKSFLYLYFCFSVLGSGYAQIKSIGIPRIVNFPKQVYNAASQNWAIVQDKRGLMFIGNNEGLLEFDGVNWRLIEIPNSSGVKALKIDKKGRIYVGAFSEFGYLEVGQRGIYHYKSLIDKIPDSCQNFANIWKIYLDKEGVIFQSFQEIFLYENDEIKLIAQNKDFSFSFHVNDSFYITEKDNGLLKFENGQLVKLPGSEIFNNNIWSMLPANSSKLVIGTTSNGLYLMENERFTKWDIPANDFLEKNQIYCSTKIGKDYYAYGTVQGGVIIIDKNGRIIQQLNKHNGLHDNTVLSMYCDNSNNLWLGLDHGIDYLIINSPLTYLEYDNNIGAGYAACIYKNNMYLGTSRGLFYKVWNKKSNLSVNHQNFKLVDNIQGQVWSLANIDNTLFCGHNEGTFIIQNERAIKISDVHGAWNFLKPDPDANFIICGTYTGLIRFVMDPGTGKWRFDRKIPGLVESCRIMEYERVNNENILWISHEYKGIYRLVLNDPMDSILNVDFFNSKSGLNADISNTVLKFDGEIIFSNEIGIFKYNNKLHRFSEYDKLNEKFGTDGVIRKIFKDNYGSYWYFQNNEMGVARLLNDGTYVIQKSLFRQYMGAYIESFENLYSYDEKNVIIGIDEGFIHYDPTKIKDINLPLKAHIRFVKTIKDSIVFGGEFTNEQGEIANSHTNNQNHELAYNYNTLKFGFSASFYENIEENKYKYILRGYDDQWSNWTNSPVKEYTKLYEGEYEFMIKAMNIYGVESEITSFRFTIRPPWHRSILAYLAYLIIVAIGLYYTINYTKNKIQQKHKLNQIKQQRDYQQEILRHQKQVLSAEQEIIKLRNEKLRIEIENKKSDLDAKNKQLANYALQLTNKNASFNKIKSHLLKISRNVNLQSQKDIQKLIRYIDSESNYKDDWDKFEMYFDQVYDDFSKKIKNNYPNLTLNDIKLCLYLRMNLTTKEIAPLFNISIRSVEVSRYRLRKKLLLSHDENLVEFLMKI